MPIVRFAPSYKEVSPKRFYVYYHCRGDDGSIFHVGKGSKNRAWKASSRNAFWMNVAKKHGVVVGILKDDMPEDCAHTLEKITIAQIRYCGAELTNASSGGEGSTGYKATEEMRKAQSILMGGRPIVCSNGMSFEFPFMASDWLKSNGHPRANQTNIMNCVVGRRKTAYGFAWWYDGDEPKEFRPVIVNRAMAIAKPVLRSDGERYESLIAAAASIDGDCDTRTAYISKACRGLIPSAYGYQWSFIDKKQDSLFCDLTLPHSPV